MAGEEVAYVTNSYADTVSVIDVAKNEVVDTIRMDYGKPHEVRQWPAGAVLELANTPMNPTFTRDGLNVWVPNPEGYNIAVVDVATNSIVRTIDLVMKPNDVEFSPDGTRAVVTLLGRETGKQGAVTVVDVATGDATDPLMIGTQPEEVVLTHDGSRAYVVSKSLWVIDVDANEVERELFVPHWCYDSVLSPDGKRLYLTATFGGDAIVVVDTETNTVAGTIDAPGGPCCMAFTDDRRMLLTTVYNNAIQYLDTESGELSEPATVGDLPSFIGLTLAGDRAYVCHPAGESVTVVDTETLAVVDTLKVDLGPCAVAIGTAA